LTYTFYVINPQAEKLIKIGYLKWKSPTDISKGIKILLEIEVRPIDVHNFIQSKQKEWAKNKVYCKNCNVDVSRHKRCVVCTRLIHPPEKCCGITHF